jgi:hypothetical protein
LELAIVLAALALSSSIALASDKPAADACAAQLATGPKQIYDLVAPEVKPDSDMKALLISKLKPMVMAASSIVLRPRPMERVPQRASLC